ncbi:prepilin-type N-terminal cleavage/methylation domain-containing protein [Desulfonatronum thiosulfatophilum]|uniref:Prepilin-type N-terminal cleavage/methylation domain-containing protein n=1 Tax=Desulfonatronum thiosulfatophilum TaxID=617002 RepID=A0A1G6CMW3_9BACT|nr:type II secretion system protein [Desulfonatronum thiosulfatophilum]SDB34236.1 prepilin-type N-terminal cleavage/methylation domain-containing protein [Desulfonatronum thiosulfatophilum]
MNKEQGFTLIEVIVVLVLFGIMVALAGLGLTTGVRGYLMAAENAEMTQKAQLAMNRLSREVRQCTTCDSGTVLLTSGSYEYSIFTEEEDEVIERELLLDGTTLKISSSGGTPRILIDQINNFALIRESDGMITITLELAHSFGAIQVFETRILPRNI